MTFMPVSFASRVSRSRRLLLRSVPVVALALMLSGVAPIAAAPDAIVHSIITQLALKPHA